MTNNDSQKEYTLEAEVKCQTAGVTLSQSAPG